MDKKKKIIIIASCIVAVIVIGLVVFFLTKDNKKNDGTPKPTPAVDKESFTISFDTDGGEKLEDLKVEKGKEFTLPTPTKKGYTFDGWYLDDKKVDNSYTFTKDVTLVAKWTEETKTLKVVFDSNGGSKVKDMTFTCTDGAATLKDLPTPTKDKYTFRTWEDKHGTPILNGASITCDGDLKLYAAWEAKEEPSTPKTPTKEKTWTCPDGYTLNESTKKCTIMKAVEGYCPDGYKQSQKDSSVCYKFAGNATENHTCKPYGGYDSGTYYYVNPSTYGCVYGDRNSYPEYNACTSRGYVYNSNYPNGGCWQYAVPGSSKVETTYNCPNGSYYKTAADLGGTISNGCYSLSTLDYGCKPLGDGYTMNHTYGKCVKTIDAELK